MRARGLTTLALALVLAGPASAQLSRDYPAKGKAIDAMRVARDYSDVVNQRARSVSLMRARAHGFVPSPELNAYVTSVLTKLLTGVPLPASFSPNVKVLGAPDFGAVCTPDGTIVLSIGLLERVESEDELAFILGHEISHAILRHHASDWFTKAQYYAVLNASTLSEVADNAQQVAAAAGVNTGVDLTNVRRSFDIATKVYALSENVLAPSFQQGQEDQADALGLDLMIKAGYSPAGADAALQHLGASEAAAQAAAASAEAAAGGGAQRSGGLGGFGSMLGGLATGALTGSGPSLQNMSTAEVLTLSGLALDAAAGSMAKETKAHRPATQRADMIAAYQFREYRDLVPGDLQRLAWGRPDPQGQLLVKVLTNYRASDAVEAYVQAQRQPGARAPSLAEARRAADIANQAPTNDHAYTQFAVSLLRTSENRAADAEAARQAALKSPEPSWIAYNAAIDEKLKLRNFAAADVTMQEAVQRFEDSPILLPKRIAILHGLGRDPEARQLLTKCTTYDVKELRTQCEKALNS
jgi:predicted Zn-dependent protease